jgi:flavin-dependent dehydrogenase
VRAGYDVVVVGGGPAGSATATLLAQRGQRVLLLERARFPRRKACAEYISPGGAAILARLGVLAAIKEDGRWLRGMQIRAASGACHTIEYCLRGERFHGLSIDRAVLDAALLDLARAHDVEVREACRATRVLLEQGRVVGVALVDGTQVRVPLVVGADGLHSMIAARVTPTWGGGWPRRIGLVAHVAGVDWPEDVGQMWVGRRGYVGVAPLDRHGLVTVGVVMPWRMRGKAEDVFAAGLAEHPALRKRLADGRRHDGLLGVGWMFRRVSRAAGPGYVLVGDAAGFFDPFTGEGIFRALRSAELAAETFDDAAAYVAARNKAFAAKDRLTLLIQVFVHAPALMELALRRLQARPRLAQRLGNMLGDLEPASLGVAWQLLRP